MANGCMLLEIGSPVKKDKEDDDHKICKNKEFHFAYLYVRCKVYIKILLLRRIKAAHLLVIPKIISPRVLDINTLT